MITKLSDLLKMESLRNVKVLTDEKGLNNAVTWICPTKLKGFDLSLSGGELMAMARTEQSDNLEKDLLVLFGACIKRKSVGIAVSLNKDFVSEIPQSVLDYANEHNFTVLEVPWSVHMADFQKDVNHFLAKSQTMEGLPSEVLHKLLSENIEDIILSLNRAESYGYPIVGNYRVYILNFLYRNYSNSCKTQNHVEKSDFSIMNNEYIVRCIDSNLHDIAKKYCIYTENNQIVFIVWFGTDSDKNTIHDIPERIVQQVKMLTSKDYRIQIGISDNHTNLSHFKRAHLEAVRSTKMNNTEWQNNEIVYYNDVGFTKLLFEIQNKRILLEFYRSRFGPLLEYDAQNSGILLDTLRCYMANNFKTDKTAEVMFIHRNTLRYRLKKIEEILGGSLDDFFFVSDLIATLRIEQILHMHT